SGFGNGSGFSSTPLTTEKSALFAPIPSASVRIAAAANPQFFANTRSPYTTSCQKFFMARPHHVPVLHHPVDIPEVRAFHALCSLRPRPSRGQHQHAGCESPFRWIRKLHLAVHGGLNLLQNQSD